jgi:hypothetical protein
LLLEVVLVLVPPGLAPIIDLIGWTSIVAVILSISAVWPLGWFASLWDYATAVVWAVTATMICAAGTLAGKWTIAPVRSLLRERLNTSEFSGQ